MDDPIGDEPIWVLEEFGVPTRGLESLEESGKLYLRDLRPMRREDFMRIRGIGRNIVDRIATALRAFLVQFPQNH